MICEHGEQPELVADKVVDCIKRLDSNGSKFMSTRSAISDTLRSEYCTAFSLQFRFICHYSVIILLSVVWFVINM